MSSRDEEWWELQAGELVLGTLDDHERDLFENIRKRDPEFQQRVTQWQAKLAPLDLSLQPVEPAGHVWKTIESRVGFTTDQIQFSESILDQTAALERVQDAFSFNDLTIGFTPTQSVSDEPVANHPSKATLSTPPAQSLIRNPNIWRDLTVLASTACLVLGIVVWNAHLREGLKTRSAELPLFDVVSVVGNEQSGATWVINAATENQSLQVSVIGSPKPASGKSYQLWMVRADNGRVSSMGLLPITTGQTVVLKTRDLDKDAVAFTVSLEPEGGSPRDTPTGPVAFQGRFQTLSLSTDSP